MQGHDKVLFDGPEVPAPAGEANLEQLTRIDMEGGVSIPGLLHIIHNASDDTVQSMEFADVVIAKLKAVALSLIHI
eukprot:15445444-Alexandrium_andersonii.AAC.1